jgi:hypothetical protein
MFKTRTEEKTIGRKGDTAGGMAMVDISTISIMIAAGSVVAGITLAVLQLRNLVKTRKTGLVINLYGTFGSEDFRTKLLELLALECRDYDDYVKKYGSYFSNSPTSKTVAVIGVYFEGVGVLLHRRLIDADLTYDLLGTPVEITWEKMKPIVEGLRLVSGRRDTYAFYEYLYGEMKRLDTKRGTQSSQQMRSMPGG